MKIQFAEKIFGEDETNVHVSSTVVLEKEDNQLTETSRNIVEVTITYETASKFDYSIPEWVVERMGQFSQSDFKGWRDVTDETMLCDDCEGTSESKERPKA